MEALNAGMHMPPSQPSTKLNRRVAEAVAKYEAMTPEEREAMNDKQRKGYVRAEMLWPRDCPYR